MEVPENFVGTLGERANGNVDGAVRQYDDLEFEIVALELFRMVPVIGDVEGEGLILPDVDRIGPERMILDGNGKDLLSGSQGRNREEGQGERKNQQESVQIPSCSWKGHRVAPVLSIWCFPTGSGPG